MQDIADQHKSIRQRLVDLEEAAKTARGGLEAVTVLLDAMQEVLARHFIEEENSELFVELPGLFPNEAAGIAHLKVEHEHVTNELGNLRRHSRRVGAGFDELAGRIDGFVATLRDHEQREARLLEMAFLEDVGA